MRTHWLLSGLLALPLAASAAPTWADIPSDAGWVKDSDVSTAAAGTVEIATKTIAGVSCFRASTTTDVPPDRLLDVATDVEGAKSWSSAGVTQAELLSRNGDKLEYFQYLDVPGWTMASDRFWFLESTIQRTGSDVVFRWQRLVDGGSHAARYKAVKEAHPSAVEPPVNVGGWIFSGTGPTKIRYYICTDSGGSIPVMVQTAATRRTLPDTVSDVVAEARRRSK